MATGVAEESGRRGSNSLPIAWKAIALPNELLPQNKNSSLSSCVSPIQSLTPEAKEKVLPFTELGLILGSSRHSSLASLTRN